MAKRLPFDHNGPPVFDSAADIPDGVPKMHYFKCDINALWDVLVELPFDLGGFYMRGLLAMYKHMEGLPADDNVARMRLGGIDIRTYRRMKAALLGQPKCFIQKPSGRISNQRFEEEISEYVTEFRNRQKAGLETAEKQRVARATRPTSAELAADFQPTSGKSPGKVQETSRELPANINREVSKKYNEINDRHTPIAVPVPSQPNRNERAILELEIESERKRKTLTPSTTESVAPAVRVSDGPRDGEEDIGHGVYASTKTIRHGEFVISVDGVVMQTLNCGLTRNETEAVCRGIAIQWALDLESGKPIRQTVPSNVANFLAVAVRRAASDRAQQGVRMARTARGHDNREQAEKAETQAQALKRKFEEAERRHTNGGTR